MSKGKTNGLQMNATEKKVITILAVAAVFSVILCAILLYTNDYYKATQKAKEAMLGTEQIEVIEKGEYYIFRSKEEISQKGIIFYPGGKVEETAYAPLLLQFAEEGYEVYLVKMPIKLAIFGKNRAEKIIETTLDIEEWTMMGHSLGGAMAAAFSAKHSEDVDRLVLLAAYSTEDLTDTEITVYSFYGTEDAILNMEKYEEYRTNLPEDTVEEVIEGANHSGYGYYGEQDNDKEASISKEEQQECVLDILQQYIPEKG